MSRLHVGVLPPEGRMPYAVTTFPTAPDDRPAPAVGDIVVPRAGLMWCSRPVPVEPHVVKSVTDYRPQGAPECIVVVELAWIVAADRAAGLRINPAHGAYLGLRDVAAVSS